MINQAEHLPHIGDSCESIIDFILLKTEQIEQEERQRDNVIFSDSKPVSRLQKFVDEMDGISSRDPFSEAVDTMKMRDEMQQLEESTEKRYIIFQAYVILREKLEREGQHGLYTIPNSKIDTLFDKMTMNAMFEYNIDGFEDEMLRLFTAASKMCNGKRFMRFFELKDYVFEENLDRFVDLMKHVAALNPELVAANQEIQARWEDPIV